MATNGPCDYTVLLMAVSEIKDEHSISINAHDIFGFWSNIWTKKLIPRCSTGLSEWQLRCVYIYIYIIVHTCMFPVQTPANQIIHLTCELVTFKASKQCEPLFWCPAAFVEHFKDVFLKY